ncbi:hypothetical protein MZM54_01065 [[Brevibacterium] frigoritolerans]|nr:hypothetical protein [Peribacillus frigoritolerans]
MKKTFIVEIEYNELQENVKKNADVLYDNGLEITVENMMEGYKETGSIQGDYKVNVKQI